MSETRKELRLRTTLVAVVVVVTGGGVMVEVGVTVVFLVNVRGIVKTYDDVLGVTDLGPSKVLHMLWVE